jgi:hypothetical protein
MDRASDQASDENRSVMIMTDWILEDLHRVGDLKFEGHTGSLVQARISVCGLRNPALYGGELYSTARGGTWASGSARTGHQLLYLVRRFRPLARAGAGSHGAEAVRVLHFAVAGVRLFILPHPLSFQNSPC